MSDFSYLDRVDPYDHEETSTPVRALIALTISGDNLVLPGTDLRYRLSDESSRARDLELIRKHLQAHVDAMHNSAVAALVTRNLREVALREPQPKISKRTHETVPVFIPTRVYDAVDEHWATCDSAP